MSDIRISSVTFRAGAAPGSQPLRIEPEGAILLVGPNNSGKSTALREIEELCWAAGPAEPKVVRAIEATNPETEEELRAVLAPFVRRPPTGQPALTDGLYLGHFTFRGGTSRHFGQQLQPLRDAMAGGNKDALWDLLKLMTIRLDGRTRFALVDAQASGDLRSQPANHLWQLFTDDSARARVRNATHEAFGLHFVIDATGMRQFEVRMSRNLPTATTERSTVEETLRFMDEARPIKDFGDGVQAFSGLMAAVYSLPHRILLIDEPDAFLHPPLARRLGRDLAIAASTATLVAATHSADFLMGCLEAAPNTTVVRLTFENDVPTARAIPGAALGALMRDPLLRSTRAMAGVFHKAVVVAEADADRAFYDEINRRLVSRGRGVDDGLFLNPQNWQTISRILGPLRRLGVPAAGVFDLDVITEATGWGAIWDAIVLTSAERKTLMTWRAKAESHLRALGPTKPHKRQGLAALTGNARSDVLSFVTRMARFGIFLVDKGELECWLPTLGIARPKKADWIVALFAALGADPSSPGYVQPKAGDVWAFLDRVGKWTSDPGRRGLPS